MTHWAMVVEAYKCTGCQTCTTSCKVENATPPGVYWRRVLDLEVGEYPNVRRVFLPTQCMHCEDPPCVSVCPTGASRRRDDGIVYIDYDICAGCGLCALSCPYGARWLIKPYEFYYGEPTEYELNKFDRRMEGAASKCTFCMHRVDRAGETGKKPGVDPEVTPMCVNSCPAGVLHFGDLDDPGSEVSRILRSKKNFRLLEELRTKPSVYYVLEEEIVLPAEQVAAEP